MRQLPLRHPGRRRWGKKKKQLPGAYKRLVKTGWRKCGLRGGGIRTRFTIGGKRDEKSKTNAAKNDHVWLVGGGVGGGVLETKEEPEDHHSC